MALAWQLGEIGRWYAQHAVIWHLYLLLYIYMTYFLIVSSVISYIQMYSPLKSSIDKLVGGVDDTSVP